VGSGRRLHHPNAPDPGQYWPPAVEADPAKKKVVSGVVNGSVVKMSPSGGPSPAENTTQWMFNGRTPETVQGGAHIEPAAEPDAVALEGDRLDAPVATPMGPARRHLGTIEWTHLRAEGQCATPPAALLNRGRPARVLHRTAPRLTVQCPRSVSFTPQSWVRSGLGCPAWWILGRMLRLALGGSMRCSRLAVREVSSVPPAGRPVGAWTTSRRGRTWKPGSSRVGVGERD